MKGSITQTAAMGRAFFHTASAGIIAAACAYGMLSMLGKGVDQERYLGILLQGFISGVVGIAIYAIILAALRNEDILLFLNTLRSKFWKQKPLTPEQPDL